MFGTKIKHKVFSVTMLVLAAAVLVNGGVDIYAKKLVAVDIVKDIGWFLILLSCGLFPQFFSAKVANETNVARHSKMGRISAQLLSVGFLLFGIAVIAELAL